METRADVRRQVGVWRCRREVRDKCCYRWGHVRAGVGRQVGFWRQAEGTLQILSPMGTRADVGRQVGFGDMREVRHKYCRQWRHVLMLGDK